MAISDKEHELISKYLDGNLSTEESTELKELSTKSTEFKNELIDQQAILAGIKAHKRDHLKKEFTNVFASLDEENKPEAKSASFKPKAYWYAIAATILLLILFLPSLFTSDPLSNDQLYAKFYEPLSLNTTSRDGVDSPRGLELYEEGKYQEAIRYLDELSNENTYKLAIIYLGVSYLEIGEIEKAQSTFNKIVEGDYDPFQKQYANWYIVLIKIRNGQKVSALKDEINKISKRGGIYSLEAKKLLEDID